MAKKKPGKRAAAKPKKPQKKRHGGKRKGAGRPKKDPLSGHEDLISELQACRRARDYLRFDQSLGVAVLDGKMHRLDADAILSISKECRQAYKVARAERAEKKVRALEILTADEVEALERHRAARRPKPNEPGEYVKPPEIAPT